MRLALRDAAGRSGSRGLDEAAADPGDPAEV